MSDERISASREPRDSEPRRRTPEDPLQALTAFAGETPDLPLEKLDFDALKVVQRLRSYGHQAYLVGGCVRDLSLGLQPKDFDVATSAHPGEIRAIFRNCRLIGRRFRLAHVYFRGGKVVETATFRANPNEDVEASQANGDLFITRDNVFGTAEEDARRRDFTINGLFYDVVLGRILDYVGGRVDLERRLIRTIGDPDVRMREDPVRLLRAVRFAAKLDLRIEEKTWAAMQRNKGEIARCAPPRVLEEIFRLLRSGYSRRCFELLHEMDALSVLLPPVAHWLGASSAQEGQALFESLGLLDEVVRKGPCPDDAVLLSTLLIHHSQHQLVKDAPGGELGEGVESVEAAAEDESVESEEVAEIEAIERATDESIPLPEETAEDTAQLEWSISARAESVEELLAELVRSARLPRRIAERARLVLHAQRILSGVRKRRSSPMKFVRQPYFSDALLVLELYARTTGHGLDALERWRGRYAQYVAEARAKGQPLPDAAAEILAAEVEAELPAAAPAAVAAPIEGEAAGGEKRKRRRGRRKRGREAPAAEVAAAGEAEAAPVAAAVAAAPEKSEGPESLPPPAERRPPPGPADFLPF
ncbi:polynucleotide adenylyltransferase PcnB [Vulgatibacter sp.]|uniref:polynucleotide adenylyltransferase PcnB n=1 Tax=Vulgatibacter sp. TaxID=1971226 RepID=UPI003565E7E7